MSSVIRVALVCCGYETCTEVVLIGGEHMTLRVPDKLAVEVNRHLQNANSPSASLGRITQGTTTWVLQALEMFSHS